MSEDQKPVQKDSHRAPSWSWPWICAFIGAACTALFADNRSLRGEIKDAEDRAHKADAMVIEYQQKENIRLRAENDNIKRFINASQSLNKYFGTDSGLVANGSTANNEQRSGTKERAN